MLLYKYGIHITLKGYALNIECTDTVVLTQGPWC